MQINWNDVSCRPGPFRMTRPTSILRGAHNCDDNNQKYDNNLTSALTVNVFFLIWALQTQIQDSECTSLQLILKCTCVWLPVTVLYHHMASKEISIGHLRVHLSLHFKVRLSAKSLLRLSFWIHIEIRPNYCSKNFTLRSLLPLKERLRRTLKWPTYHGCCVALNLSHQLTGHGLCQAPRICSILHKNARKKNSPQSNNRETKKKHQLSGLDNTSLRSHKKTMHQCQRQEHVYTLRA